MQFSRIHLEKPLIILPTGGRRFVKSMEEIVKKINDISLLMNTAGCIVSNIYMEDFRDIHDDEKNPTDKEMQRTRNIHSLMPSIQSFVYMIEDIAREWLKQRLP